MGLQVPATLAALGPHEILKLGDLFVEAIDILVKEPIEKQCHPKSLSQQLLSHLEISGGRAEWELPAVPIRTKGPASSSACSGSVPAE